LKAEKVSVHSLDMVQAEISAWIFFRGIAIGEKESRLASLLRKSGANPSPPGGKSICFQNISSAGLLCFALAFLSLSEKELSLPSDQAL